MKQPLSWHRECFANVVSHLETRREDLRRLRAVVDALERDADFYQQQIFDAERRGLDGFDSERLLKARGG